ncbi:MAG: Uridylate kinase [Candidatus Dependentiae bacterium ADurb.Bin331]|nr:MAG: Uridylate kinase [Candidatus Dependentiae bacterium ADurb.Bin331]
MLMNSITILLKLTGEVLLHQNTQKLNDSLVRSIARQIKQLESTHRFGIVIGGGNFFRGSVQGTVLKLTPSIGHQIGMLATMMNGLIIKDLFEQEGLSSTLFCAVPASEIGAPISHQTIENALVHKKLLIFTGGTGNPFFTTDTTAILRGLQINATQVWKGTTVDGIYTADPKKDPCAQRLSTLSYDQALMEKMGIMDATAIALARQHRLPIRVFNIFHDQAIICAAEDQSFGSTMS